MDTKYDQQQKYCRKLGHFLNFDYCRREELNYPCRAIRSCWMENFDIDQFLNDNFSKNDISYLFTPAPPKMSRIVELISAVQQKSENTG